MAYESSNFRTQQNQKKKNYGGGLEKLCKSILLLCVPSPNTTLEASNFISIGFMRKFVRTSAKISEEDITNLDCDGKLHKLQH